MKFVPFDNDVDCFESHDQVIENGMNKIVFYGHPIKAEITKDKAGQALVAKLLLRNYGEQRDWVLPVLDSIAKALDSSAQLPERIEGGASIVSSDSSPFA